MKLGNIIMSSYKTVTHVIFESVGTLINSDEVVLLLYQKISSRYGKCLTVHQKSQVMRMQPMETVDYIIKEHSLPLTVEDFYHDIIKGLRKLTGNSFKLKPGVEELVKHLHSNRIPLAISTSSVKELYDISTKNYPEMMSYFHHIVEAPSEPEIMRDKPAPDVFLECARQFDEKPSPEKVLVVGSSVNGVEAAVAAGMQVVAVPNFLINDKFFKNATLVLETLKSFKPELFGLPPFPNEYIIKPCYKPVTHVKFDFDGTIIEIEQTIINVFQAVVEKYGKHLTSSQLKPCIGLHLPDRYAFVIKELDLSINVEEFNDEAVAVFGNTELKIKPGVERLVKHLYKNKVPIAIATNSPKERFQTATKDYQELINYFHHSVTGPSEPEVKRDKPFPDVFLVCARRFKDSPSPEKVLVIEDSPCGVEAAVAAGMQVVMVPDPLLDPELRKNATLVLDSLDCFQPELFGLPPFPK